MSTPDSPQPETLFGFPVVIGDAMPVPVDGLPLRLGDLSAYMKFRASYEDKDGNRVYVHCVPITVRRGR